MTFTIGIYMTGILFFEPLFRYLIISWIYQFYGVIYESSNAEKAI